MGRSTTSDVVSFALNYVFYDSGNSSGDNWGNALENPELYLERVLDSRLYEAENTYGSDSEQARKIASELKNLSISNFEINGWKLRKSDVRCGKRSCIYANLFSKGDFEIYAINESPYSDGGEIELTIFSDDRKSLIEFRKDFLDNNDEKYKIEEVVSVQQTL